MKILFAFIAGVFCVSAQAAQMFGNWEVSELKDLRVARVGGAAGSTAGVMCTPSEKTCSAFISIDFSCEDGASYPVMLNSNAGAYSSTGVCASSGDSYYLLIDDFNATISAFESGGEVGFAFPLKSGQFRVLRFNCQGATAAIKLARTLPKTTATPRNPASQVL